MDPGEVRSQWVYVLLGFYIAHAGAIMFLLRVPQQSTPGFRLLVHSVDILLPALLSPFTAGQSNPFFLFFVFVLAAAAYRWGLWETLMTAVASLSLLWMESLSFEVSMLRSANGWNGHDRISMIRVDTLGIAPKRLFMQSVYLIVMALLLGYLAERQKKLRAERDIAAKMLGLVRVDTGLGATLSRIFGEFLRLYGAKCALIAARETGTHRIMLGMIEADSLLPEWQWLDSSPGAAENYLRASSAVTWYARRQSDSSLRICGLDAAGRSMRDFDWTIARDFERLHPFQKLAAASFSFSNELSGRVLLVDPEFASQTDEELRFFQDLVRQITPAIYNVYLLRRLRRRAGAAERARLVRELHDGAVQSLIGVEMQVDVLRRHPPAEQSITRELERIQGLLREEVLKLRELMQEMKSTEVDARRLPGFLRDTVQRFQRETGISAQFIFGGDEVALPQAVCRELARIVQEALVNVRKHSRASCVTVQLLREGTKLQLIIDDDGLGFPFSGRIAQGELDSTAGVPIIIRERVHLIQGELAIESTPGKGSRLEISIPQLKPAEVGTNLNICFNNELG
jgi:signal transduction histidine kinase